jgi:hypothetical protein
MASWRTPHVVLTLSLVALSGGARNPNAAASRATSAEPHSALVFEENRGQFDPAIRYAARGAKSSAYITTTGSLWIGAAPSAISERAALIKIEPVHGRREPQLVALEDQIARVHVFHGTDPARWVRDIPTFGRIRIPGLYEGVDVEYYLSAQHLEYDFVIAPGHDPATIRLRVDGASVTRDDTGELVLDTTAGQIRQRRPVAYQDSRVGRQQVTVDYDVSGREVGFLVGAYDRARPLVIDPVLLASTYLGGSNVDSERDVVFGSDGLYVTGETSSSDFPTSGSLQPFRASSDVFVVKYSTDGRTLLFATYYGGGQTRPTGGESRDEPRGIAIDDQNAVYVVGTTLSTDLPIAGAALQRTLTSPTSTASSDSDGFLFKLAADGSALLLSTYLGSGTVDVVTDVAVATDVYITGTTSSAYNAFSFPLLTSSGPGFVLRLTRDGQPLAGRLVPGEPQAIAVGPDGSPFIAGTTSAPGLATAGAFQTTPGNSSCSYGFHTSRACEDGFVTHLAADLSSISWATYIRETSVQTTHAFEIVSGIAVDAQGAVYITGQTQSEGFPVTPGAYQTTCLYCNQPTTLTGPGTAFVSKLNAAGSALLFSTFLGGSLGSVGMSLALDPTGAVFVTGVTSSSDFPESGSPLPSGGPNPVGRQRAFISLLNPAGNALLYSSKFGGTSSDLGGATALSRYGSVAVAGRTASTDFPVVSAVQATYGGGGLDAFLALVSVPRVVTVLDAPPDGATTRAASVTLRGWAVDTRASAGPGIDGVHVYAYPNGGAGPPMFLGLATLGESRADVAGALGSNFSQAGFSLTTTLAQDEYLFVAYAHSSVTAEFGTPAVARARAETGAHLKLDSPAPGAAPEVLTVSGYAVDLDAPTGTGVDTVHVWAYPNPGSGQAPRFLGVATYGAARPQLAIAYGARFGPSGFTLSASLAPGPWLVVAHGHSTVTTAFSVQDTSLITVRASAPEIHFEAPIGPAVYQGFHISGWAIDPNSPGGSGIDAVHAWAYPNPGSGQPAVFLGATTTALPRRDIAVANGLQFFMSGFDIRTALVPAGQYLVVVFARSAVTGRFDVYQTRSLEVRAANDAVLEIETPLNAWAVPGVVNLQGFAFDPRASDGLGVDGIHVWVYPNWGSGASPYFAGLAYYGQEQRPELGQAYGTNYATSGFSSGIALPVGSGTHLIAVFAHSTVTGAFTSRTVLVTVPASDPLIQIDIPQNGAVGPGPLRIAGWAIDRAAATLQSDPSDIYSRDGISYKAFYAYPNPGSGTPPITLAGVVQEVARPDVAAVYGSRFLDSGFQLDVSNLPPGVYDIAVFGWSVLSQQFGPPVVVRVTVQ